MNDIETKILIGMHRNVNDMDRKTANIASAYNLTFSQFMVLEALYSKGDMTVGEVRDHILSSVGTISVIINNLVKMKYIERLPDKKDRRICILHLTDEGGDVIAKVAPQNEKMIIDYISVLSESEKKDLLYLIKKLGGKLDEKRGKN